MQLGMGPSISDTSAYGTPFDPTSVALTGYWRASFSASPWSGVSSAGGSGGRDLTEAVNPPTAGTTVNGLAPALFNGSSQHLNGAAMSNFLNVSAFSGWALVNAASVAADVATPSAVCILNTHNTGQVWVYLRSSGKAGLAIFDGASNITVEANFTIGSWQLVQFKHTGTALTIRVNGGAWATPVASGAVNNISNAIDVGQNPSNTQFLNGSLLEVGLTNTTLADATFDSILAYTRNRYALSLP